MRSRSPRSSRARLVLTGLLASIALAILAVTLLLAAALHDGSRQRPVASAEPAPAPRLDRAGMADLMVLRTTTRTTAARAAAAVESCLRRHGAAPITRRARMVRNCAFRPLAGAGASRQANAMILSSLRDRLRSGPCLEMVNAYGTIVIAFSSSAEQVVRTTGEWAPTGAAAASTRRLGRWVVRYSDRPDWSAACLRRPGPRALNEAA